MKKTLRLILLSFLYAGWVAAAAGMAEAETIGVIQIASGQCSLIRGEHPMAVQTGLKLLDNDILETSADGKLGIVLRDDTLLSIGPGSRFVLDRFSFAPAEKKLGLAARLSRGTAMVVSGQIAKMAPESVQIETPMAVLGVRGTRFAVKVSE